MKNPTPTTQPSWLPDILNSPTVKAYRKVTTENCENPRALAALLDEVTIRAQYCGTQNYFNNDKQPRPVFLVTITRGKDAIQFPFGASVYDGETINTDIGWGTGFGDVQYHHKRYFENGPLRRVVHTDRMKFPANLLYSILCTVGSEWRPVGAFSEWCADFGYNTDSRKAHKTWEDCGEMSAMGRRIFAAHEIELMPQ